MKIFKKICGAAGTCLVLLSPSLVGITDNQICPEPVPTNLSFDNELVCNDAEETQAFLHNPSSAVSGSATSWAVAISGPSIMK